MGGAVLRVGGVVALVGVVSSLTPTHNQFAIFNQLRRVTPSVFLASIILSPSYIYNLLVHIIIVIR